MTTIVRSGKKMSDAVHAGWRLVAQGQRDEARALVDPIADTIQFSGDYTLWGPGSNAICLAARLAPRARRARLIARLVERPSIAVMPRDRLVEWVAGAARGLEAARAEPRATWAIQRACTAAMDAAYFHATDGAGSYYDGWLDLPALDRVIEEAMALVKDRLGAAAPRSRPPARRRAPRP